VEKRRALSSRWAGGLILLILVTAGFVYSRDLSSVSRLHPDEGLWILSGKLATDVAFRHRDVHHPFWEHPLQTWGAANPQIGKYFFGLAVQVSAPRPAIPDFRITLGGAYPSQQEARFQIADMLITSAEHLLGYSRHYDFSQQPSWNAEHGRAPSPDLIWAARIASVLAGLAAAFVLCLIAGQLEGPLAAGIVLVLFLLNPVLVRYSTVATTDVLVLLFVLAGTLGVVRFLGRPSVSTSARTVLALATGAAWGLAISTKLSSLAPWLGAISLSTLVCFLAVTRGRPRSGSAPGRLSVGAGSVLFICLTLIPGAIFIATNTFLSRAALEPFLGEPSRFSVMLGLGRLMSTYDVPGKILSTMDTVRSLVDFFLHHASISKTLGLPWALEPIAFFVGLGVLTRRAVSDRRQFGRRADWIAFLWISLATWTVTLYWLPFSWPRLHIPLLPFYLLISGLGLTAMMRALLSGWERWRLRN
jgi:hypothetical protein